MKSLPSPQARKARQRNLARMLRPERIAFIGGRQLAGPIRACRRGGFSGDIAVVNPHRDVIEDIACTPAIEALDTPPDAVLIALSPERSVEAVAQLQAIGAGGAVILASGFAELGEQGRALQDSLRHVAGDMALLGPNCMGFLNQFDGVAVWGEDTHVESVEAPGCAILSQSGAMLVGIANVERAFPMGYALSVGNQAVLDLADGISVVLEDERVRAIGIYIEGLEDGAALADACALALEKDVPIVALKGGEEEAGARVAAGHTAAMVVASNLWDAFRQRYAIAEVATPKAMVESLKYLSVGGMPKGGRVSVVSFSGGLNGVLAAQAPGLGLNLPAPTPKNTALLRALLPATVPVANPLDLNVPFRSSKEVSLEDVDSIAEGMVALASDVSDQLVFFLDVPHADKRGLEEVWLPSVASLELAAKQLKIPCAVAGILPEGLEVALRRRLLAAGVVPLLGYGDAMEALRVAAWLAKARERMDTTPPPLLSDCIARDSNAKPLDEAASKEILRAHGFETPAFRVVSIEDIEAVVREIGFPLALKICSEAIVHKAQVGGVCLNLSSAEEVSVAANAMRVQLQKTQPEVLPDKFLLEPMVEEDGIEFILGIKSDPALGMALLLGIGGSEVEARARFQTLLLPLVSWQLEEAIAALDVPLNESQRGALIQAVKNAEALALVHRGRLLAMDINPLLVTHSGAAIAIDAFFLLGEESV